jgi:hypothetical protein
MVVTVHIDRSDITRILIDKGSQAKILFLLALKMGYDSKKLKEMMKPSMALATKELNQLGS